MAHYRAGDWKSAIEALEKSIELREGGDSFDWFVMAMAHWQQGHKVKAREWYDRAVAWMEKNPDIEENREQLHGFREEAEKLIHVKEDVEVRTAPNAKS